MLKTHCRRSHKFSNATRNGLLVSMLLLGGMSVAGALLRDPLIPAGLGNPSDFDGPAQLPMASVASSTADTPAPGRVITVIAGDDLQGALNSAQCGDTIQLQAGAVFTGTFRFPALNCDDSHWVVVRTSSPDNALPAEGNRLTPCYAGVVALPGRPQYVCNTPQNVLAKLVAGRTGPITFQAGANHYRLVGLEVTRPVGVKGPQTLIAIAPGGTASHIVLDRSWVHGTMQDETRNGFSLSRANYVAVVDSYFSDFHCTAVTGSCLEAHAIAGGSGDHQDGPFRIENNFLEASGQAILFGGAAATRTPTDITIRFNHFFKPLLWRNGNSPFQGGASGNPFIVRHALELKNASRVLIEANLVENVWGGFGEPGDAILLTPKNQHDPSGANVCPSCRVTDITVRYVHIIHAAGGVTIGTFLSGNGNNGAAAAEGARYSIHDLLMDDISRNYLGSGRLFMVANSWPANPVNTIAIDHITGFPDPDSGVLSLGNLNSNPEMYGFALTNSIFTTGRYPVWNVGDKASCASRDEPLISMTNCFSSYSFSNNALIASPARFPASSWPDGNFFPPGLDDVGFVEGDGGSGADYALQPDSPYKSQGTDGRDLGADIVGLNNALAGIE